MDLMPGVTGAWMRKAHTTKFTVRSFMFQELSRKTVKKKKIKGYNHGLGGEGNVRL